MDVSVSEVFALVDLFHSSLPPSAFSPITRYFFPPLLPLVIDATLILYVDLL